MCSANKIRNENSGAALRGSANSAPLAPKIASTRQLQCLLRNNHRHNLSLVQSVTRIFTCIHVRQRQNRSCWYRRDLLACSPSGAHHSSCEATDIPNQPTSPQRALFEHEIYSPCSERGLLHHTVQTEIVIWHTVQRVHVSIQLPCCNGHRITRGHDLYLVDSTACSEYASTPSLICVCLVSSPATAGSNFIQLTVSGLCGTPSSLLAFSFAKGL